MHYAHVTNLKTKGLGPPQENEQTEAWLHQRGGKPGNHTPIKYYRHEFPDNGKVRSRWLWMCICLYGRLQTLHRVMEFGTAMVSLLLEGLHSIEKKHHLAFALSKSDVAYACSAFTFEL